MKTIISVSYLQDNTTLAGPVCWQDRHIVWDIRELKVHETRGRDREKKKKKKRMKKKNWPCNKTQ